MRRTRITKLAPVCAVALFTTLLGAPAFANDCGAVDAQGTCEDAETLVWCADGVLMTLPCPPGEVCSAHDVFDGGYGCVPPENTPCGDIPAEGECTSAGNVVWCLESGKLELKQCGEDAVCGWDSANEWYDCLPASSMMAGGGQPESGDGEDGAPSESDGSGGEAPEGVDAGSKDNETDAGSSEDNDASADGPPPDGGYGPTPGVTPGTREENAPASASSDEDSVGCSGGARDRLPPWWSLSLLLLFRWRRPSSQAL